MTRNDLALRHVLLTATRDLHEDLDRHVGAFSDVGGYGLFLTGSHAFRAALEPVLSDHAAWPVQPLADLIGRDLADLGQPCPPRLAAPDLSTPAAQAAACYVLEGSALGARVLARRAAELGFDGNRGARHLAAQTGDRQRWPRFLAWLERIDAPRAEATLAAREIFDLALRAYGARAAA